MRCEYYCSTCNAANQPVRGCCDNAPEAREIITRARPTSTMSAMDALYPVKMTHTEALEIGLSMERSIAKKKVRLSCSLDGGSPWAPT